MQGLVQLACSPALFFFLQTRYAFIFVRSPPALFERLRSPPGNDGLTLEHSIANKTAKAGISLILLPSDQKKKDISLRISPTQQDSLEPARLSRISKIPSNRTDSLSDSRPPNPADIRPRLLRHRVTSPHSCPQPGTQPCRVICHQETHRTFSGSCGNHCGPRATVY